MCFCSPKKRLLEQRMHPGAVSIFPLCATRPTRPGPARPDSSVQFGIACLISGGGSVSPPGVSMNK